jgi:hypothetical protein
VSRVAARPRDRADHGVAFWLAVLVGWGLIVVGIVGFANRRGTGDLLPLGVWIVGGDVVHDALLVPATLLVTVLVTAFVPEPWRAPLLAGLGATACILLVSIPLLGGYGRKAGNPTVLPLDYGTAVPTAVGIAWLLALGWLVVRLVTRAHRAA